MNIESIAADQMAEDAWEQRNEFSDKLFDIIKKMKSEQVREDIAINSLLIATIYFFDMETEDDEVFLKYAHYYSETLLHAAKEWVVKDE